MSDIREDAVKQEGNQVGVLQRREQERLHRVHDHLRLLHILESVGYSNAIFKPLIDFPAGRGRGGRGGCGRQTGSEEWIGAEGVWRVELGGIERGGDAAGEGGGEKGGVGEGVSGNDETVEERGGELEGEDLRLRGREETTVRISRWKKDSRIGRWGMKRRRGVRKSRLDASLGVSGEGRRNWVMEVVMVATMVREDNAKAYSG